MYEAAPGVFIPEGQTLDTMHHGDAMAEQILAVTGEFYDFHSKVEPTATVWVTKDGTQIAVVDMGDDHLRNTIRMLRRNVEHYRMELVVQMGAYIENAPDGAAMACELEADELADLDFDDPEDEDGFLSAHVKPYKLMLKEARRRKLNLEDQIHV